METIEALARLLPLGDSATGHGGAAAVALRVDEVLARRFGALGAFVGVFAVVSHCPGNRIQKFGSCHMGC